MWTEILFDENGRSDNDPPVPDSPTMIPLRVTLTFDIEVNSEHYPGMNVHETRAAYERDLTDNPELVEYLVEKPWVTNVQTR